jgi:hypothetical protein
MIFLFCCANMQHWITRHSDLGYIAEKNVTILLSSSKKRESMLLKPGIIQEGFLKNL